MTYDLRLGATVTGANDVKLLADSVAVLASKLPVLASALENFKGFGDIKGINQGIKVLDALQKTVAGVDTAKIRETARDIDKLAASLTKLDGKTLPKGFMSPSGGAQGFKAASDLKAMAQSMSDSNQAVASALAQLSTTIKTGYAKAEKTAETEEARAAAKAKKTADKKAQAAKDDENSLQAQYAQMHAQRMAKGKDFSNQELEVIRAAGVKLRAEHAAQLQGLSKTDKDRLDQMTSGRFKSASTQPNTLADAANAADADFSKAYSQKNKKTKEQREIDAAWAARNKQLDAEKLEAKRQSDAMFKSHKDKTNADDLAATNDYIAKNNEANSRLDELEKLKNKQKAQALKERQNLDKLAAASASKNAEFLASSELKQAQSILDARRKLDQKVPLANLARQYGSIATYRASKAESAADLERKVTVAEYDKSAKIEWDAREKANSQAAKRAAAGFAQAEAEVARQVKEQTARMWSEKESADKANATKAAAVARGHAKVLGEQNLQAQLATQKEIREKLAADAAKQKLSQASASKNASYLQGDADKQLAAKIAAASKLDQGVNLQQVIKDHGSIATLAAKRQGLAALQAESENKTLGILQRQALAMDQIAAAEKAAAADVGTVQALRKAGLLEAQRAVNAKKDLIGGASQPEVAAKYGNVATSVAQASSLDALVSKQYQLGSVVTANSPKMATMTKQLDMLHSAARGAASGFGAMWLTWGQVAPLLAGAALSHSFVQTVKMGAELGDQLDIIRNLAGATETEIKSLKDELLSLSTGAVGPQKVAEAAVALSLAGLQASQTKSALQDVLNLSIAGTTDIKTSAEVMVSVATAFGYTAEQYGRVGDVIAKTAAVSIADITDMSAAFKYSTTVAEQYGVSLEDVATTLASLAQRGIKGSSAGVATRQMFQEFTGATLKTDKELKKLGVEAFDGATGKLKPLLQLMYELENSMVKLSKTDVSKKIRDLFNERASKAVVGVKNDYDRALKDLEDFERRAAKAGTAGLTSRDGKQTNMTAQGKMGELVGLINKGDMEGYKDELSKLAGVLAFTEKSLLGVQHATYNTSAGFSALAAAGRAMSTKNMMEGVTNTLKTSLVQAFDEIEPVVVVVASRMKEMFASPTFKQGVVDLATAVANLTFFISKNLDTIVMLTKGWLVFKTTALAASLFTAATVGVASFTSAVGMAAAKTLPATAALTGTGVAANFVAASAPRAAAGIGLMSVAATKLSASMGVLGVVVTAAYAAWMLFKRDGEADVTAFDAAKLSAQEYGEELDKQVKHQEALNKARREGLAISAAESKVGLENQIEKLREAAGLQAKEDNDRLAKIEKLEKASPKPAVGRTAGDELRDKIAKDAAEARKQEAYLRERAAALVKAAEEGAKIPPRGKPVTPTTPDDSPETSAAAAAKAAREAEKLARELAKGEMAQYDAKLKKYRDTVADIEAADKRYEEFRNGLAKAGIETQDLANVRIAANHEQSAKRMAAAYAEFRTGATADLEAVQGVLRNSAKTVDKTQVEAAQARLEEMKREADNMGKKESHTAVMHALKPMQGEFKMAEDMEAFGRAQEKTLKQGIVQAVMKRNDLELTKEQIALNTALLKHEFNYAEKYEGSDKAIAAIEADLVKVTAETQKAAAAFDTLNRIGAAFGAEALPDLERSQAAVRGLEEKLVILRKARDGLKLTEEEQRKLVIDGVMQEQITDKVIENMAKIKAAQETLVTDVNTSAKGVFDSALDGQGNVINRFANSFGKALEKSVNDAFYNSFFKKPLEGMATKLSEMLFPIPGSVKEEGEGGTNLFAAESNKYLSKNPMDQAFDTMTAKFKAVDWEGMWGKVKDAFNDIDWGAAIGAIKSLFMGGSSGGGELGRLISVGSTFLSGGAGYQGNAGQFMGPTMPSAVGHTFDKAQRFAKGSAFANTIVNTPTYFKYGSNSLGQMGEAGPEAIIPLARNGKGQLGVAATGMGGSHKTVINNHSHTYNVGSGVTRADLARFGAQVVQVATGKVADGVKRNDGRFARS